MWSQVPYCKREAEGDWLQRRRCEDGGKRLGAWEEGARSQGVRWPPEAGKGKDTDLLGSLQEEPALPTPCSQALGLASCKRMNLCVFRHQVHGH